MAAITVNFFFGNLSLAKFYKCQIEILHCIMESIDFATKYFKGFTYSVKIVRYLRLENNSFRNNFIISIIVFLFYYFHMFSKYLYNNFIYR